MTRRQMIECYMVMGGVPYYWAGRAKIYECAASYPARTSKRLAECEVRGVFA